MKEQKQNESKMTMNFLLAQTLSNISIGSLAIYITIGNDHNSFSLMTVITASQTFHIQRPTLAGMIIACYALSFILSAQGIIISISFPSTHYIIAKCNGQLHEHDCSLTI